MGPCAASMSFAVEGPRVAEKRSYMKSEDFVHRLGLQIAAA